MPLAPPAGLGDAMRILANVEDVEELYRAADVFVIAGNGAQETQGLALLEAMASGLPVVAPDWDGYRDAVDNGTTGFLAPTLMVRCTPHLSTDVLLGDPLACGYALSEVTVVDAEALGAHLLPLCRDAEVRSRLGNAGRVKALREFRLATMVSSYESLWGELRGMAQGQTRTQQVRRLVPDYTETFASAYPTRVLRSDDQVVLCDVDLDRVLVLDRLSMLPIERLMVERAVSALGGRPRIVLCHDKWPALSHTGCRRSDQSRADVGEAVPLLPSGG